MIRGVAGNWSRHILGWCHINFIKPKTYSALLPLKAYDGPRLWNEFMRVTKHFLQRIFRYYDVCMTYFLPYDSKTNIWANTVQILQKQPPPLATNTWRNFSTTCIICAHRHPNQLLTHVVTRVYESSFQRTEIFTAPRWRLNGTLERRTCGALSGCDGVTCSRFGSVGVFCT